MTDNNNDDETLANLVLQVLGPNQFLLTNTPPIETTVESNLDTMAKIDISVKDYLDLIPQFDGDASKLPIFLDTCEQVLGMLVTDNNAARIQFLMLHFRNKIIGKAAQILAAREIHTFPELKFLLLNTFGDQRNEESLLNDLMMLTQNHNESHSQFADRCISLRSLLLSKVQMADISVELRQEKIMLYNKMALRTFLSGLNAHLSHLLRCKEPRSLEDAINMVVEEENMNYNRQQKLGTKNNFQKNNQSQLRTTSNNYGQQKNNPTSYSQQFQPKTNPTMFRPMTNTPHRLPNYFNSRYPQQSFQQKPFQTFQNFQRQNFQTPQNFQANQNFQNPQRYNFQPKPQQTYPQPMDTSSGNTRTKFPQTTNTPRWTAQELHLQEIPSTSSENYEYEPDFYQQTTFNPENPENYYYPEEQFSEDYQNFNENENFPIPASETDIMNPMNTKNQQNN